MRLREAHDDILGARILDARVAGASDRSPFHFGNETLGVGELQSAVSHFVAPTEGLGEVGPHERTPLDPVVVYRATLLSDGSPEVRQLLRLRHRLVRVAVEVVDGELN